CARPSLHPPLVRPPPSPHRARGVAEARRRRNSRRIGKSHAPAAEEAEPGHLGNVGWHPSDQRLVALLVGRQPVQVIAVAMNPRKFRTPPDTSQLSTPSTR